MISLKEMKVILEGPRFKCQSFIINGHFHTTIVDTETGLSSLSKKYNSYDLSRQSALSELLEKIHESS